MRPLLKFLGTIILLFALREVVILDLCAATLPIIPGVSLCVPPGVTMLIGSVWS